MRDEKVGRKGAMGIYTLIIMISLLMVAAIVAAVILRTTDETRESAYKTGQQAKSQISTHLSAYELVAEDGRGHNLTDFQWVLKITSGSDRVKLDKSIVRFQTDKYEAVLKYRPDGRIEKSNQGYNTWNVQEMGEISVWDELVVAEGGTPLNYLSERQLNLDLDGDNINDTVRVCGSSGPCPAGYGGTHLRFTLSSAGFVYVPLLLDNGTLENISGATGNPVNLTTVNQSIGSYGRLHIVGRTEENDALRSWTYLRVTVYKNPETLNEDLDDDGLNDSVAINKSHVLFHISSYGWIPIELNTPLTGAVTLDVDENIAAGNEVFGSVYISGTTSQAGVIDDSVTFKVTPKRLHKGYYVAEYLQKGEEYRKGVISRGDIVRLHFESPETVEENDHIKLIFQPKSGAPTITEIDVPDVIKEPVVSLFP